MTWLLKLYPRDWRRRYAGEVEILIASERRSVRLFLDLLAGAIDARLNPQFNPETQKGSDEMISIQRLCAARFSREEHLRSAGWMLGASLVFSALGVGLDKLVGESLFSRAVLYGAFPMALILSSGSTYFKLYSPVARRILVLGGTAAVFLFMLAVTWLSDVI